MKKIKVSFDTWIQLLGMVGVLGGLVFVGLEMQQTQNIALAEQQQTRMQTWIGIVNVFTETGLDWQDIIAGNVTEENDFAYSNVTHQSLWTMENDFIQNKLVGFSSEIDQDDVLYSYYVGFDKELNLSCSIYGRMLLETIRNAISLKKKQALKESLWIDTRGGQKEWPNFK